jgi:uncharacterized protein YjgD (DUF1641 family)
MTAVQSEAGTALPGGSDGGAGSVEQRLDRLSAQVDELVAEMRRQREAREQWSELTHELAPVTRDAMDLASRELEQLSHDVTVEDLTEFLRTLVRSVPKLKGMLQQLDSLSELTEELTLIAGSGVAKLSDKLAEAERKGYFVFARHGAAMVEEVVTSFGEDDVVALRDNVVLILNTVKELTQPEVMTLLNRTGVSLQTIQDDAGVEPPSALALLKQMRDPQVRRGLGRTLALLRTVGEEPSAAALPPGAGPAPSRPPTSPTPTA